MNNDRHLSWKAIVGVVFILVYVPYMSCVMSGLPGSID